MLALLLLVTLVAFSSAEKRVTLGPALASMSAQNLLDRSTYVKGMNQIYYCKMDSAGTYTSSVQHTLVPTTKVFNLDAVWYGKNSAGLVVDPPALSLSNVNGYTLISATFTGGQLTDSYGCSDLPTNVNYVGKLCSFTVDYIAVDQGAVIMTTDFGVTIKIPKTASVSGSTSATKIYRKGCDCEILSALPLSIALFTDTACTVAFTGPSITYGSNMCLKVTSTNAAANSYTFEMAIINMAYPAQGVTKTVDITAVSTRSCGNPCQKGLGMAYFDVSAVGSPVTFTVTVILRSSQGRLLVTRQLGDPAEGNGLQGSSPAIPVTGVPSSSASGLLVAVLSFLSMLLLIL